MSKKAIKVKCLPIPKVLLPVLPENPVAGHPMWLSEVPDICMLKRGDCITLDDVVWRDRDGWIRTTKRGFPNDGMSYTWLGRLITGWDNYDPETLRSGVTHDCPYSMYDHLCNWPLKRKKVDVDLLDGLRADKNPSLAWIKYRFVRRIGWIAWGIKTKDPLVIEWIEALWQGEKTLDKWIERTVLVEGV